MNERLDGATIRAERTELVGRPGLAGRPLVEALAAQADGWFARLGAGLPDGWALIATGGYGRGALCPCSDLDVMLLHPQRTSDARVGEVAEGIWYPVWDSGLKLSPATHTVKGLMTLASRELVTATAILSVRRLAGDDRAADDVARRGLEQWRRRAVSRLRELREASTQRWARAGEVSSLLEPNLKDGRGGLRDCDVLRWAIATGIDDVASSLEAPLAGLDAEADVLLAARSTLHRITGRPSDVLLLQDQDAVAAALGVTDADVLMRTVSGAARNIDWASDRFWRRVDRVIDPPRWPGHRSPAMIEPVASLGVEGDELHLTAAADLDEPSVVFAVAAAAARNDIPLSREALTTLAEETPSSPPEPWSERTRRAFVSLLAAGEPMVAVVEALEHYGLFSRYLPEWSHVRSLPQRNAFHTYNVDRHLLRTVANASQLVRRVARPDLLLVAALLHDIGKGYPRDHTEVGIELAPRIVGRMGFDDGDTATVTALVEHHLLLPETATRRDLADPRTVDNVAAALQTVERLELLRALTEADSLATGPAAWSRWKLALVDRLTWAVSERLRGNELPPSVDVEERFGPILEQVRAGAELVTDHDVTPEFVRLRVAARDRPGLFATVAGTLVLHRVDVTSADAWTTADGVAVEQFHILPTPDGPPPLHKFHQDLDDALTGRLDLAARLDSRVAAAQRGYRRATAATPARTEVIVSNEASDSTTMVDVRVPDGPAVLYQLSAALAGRGLNIRSAKIATLGHEVVDVFYVQRAASSAGQLPADEHAELRDAVTVAVL